MKIGGNDINNIKAGSTTIKKVINNGIVYYQAFNTPTDFADLSFWAAGRSGFTMVDSVAGNNVNILTPVYQGQTGSSLFGTNNALERVFDGGSYTIYFKTKMLANTPASGYFFQLGNTTGPTRGISYWMGGGYLYFEAGDGTNNAESVISASADTTIKNAGWVECFIEVDKATNRLRNTIYKLSDGTTLGTNKNVDISTWTFNNNNNGTSLLFTTTINAICDFKKFSALKTITQCRDNTYVTDLQFWYPEMLSGTDVSGNNHHLTLNGVTDANKYYSDKSTYLLDKGYTIHKRIGYRDIIVPYDVNGAPIYRSGYLTYNGDGLGPPDSYHETIEEPGSLTNINLTDCLLEFPGEQWNRSNATIFNSACTSATYYDVANPKRWHVSEMNKITLNSYTNTNYQGIHFPKVTGNSYDNRHLLTDIITYTANKTGSQLASILKYTNDNDIPNTLYLSSPYAQVVRITANQDSEFKFNLNNSIVYTRQAIFDKIDGIPLLNPNEDLATKIYRWSQANMDIWINNSQTDLVNANIIATFNSFAASACGGLATNLYNILQHYYPNNGNNVASLTGFSHITNYFDSAYIDIGYQLLLYKGFYSTADAPTIKLDEKLVIEPLRQNALSVLYSHNKWLEICSYEQTSGYNVISTVDNLTMKLPANSTFVFPFKSANIPKNYDNTDMVYYANGLGTFATGITGVVQMPFTLLQITGTGSVKVDNVTYTLPANAAALKTVLQRYTKFLNSFEILTNTGGINAEWLVNPRRMLLWNYNNISKGIITGDIAVESLSTATPVPTCYLALAKKQADSWTINYDQFKNMSGLIKIPLPAANNYTIAFSKTGNKIPREVKFINGIANSLSVVGAGAPVIDQCFASKLTPGDVSFSSTLPLSFTTYDGSSCYYTLDGSTPNATKTLYTGSFTISATTTIKWINIKADYADSHINSRIITKTA